MSIKRTQVILDDDDDDDFIMERPKEHIKQQQPVQQNMFKKPNSVNRIAQQNNVSIIKKQQKSYYYNNANQQHLSLRNQSQYGYGGNSQYQNSYSKYNSGENGFLGNRMISKQDSFYYQPEAKFVCKNQRDELGIKQSLSDSKDFFAMQQGNNLTSQKNTSYNPNLPPPPPPSSFTSPNTSQIKPKKKIVIKQEVNQSYLKYLQPPNNSFSTIPHVSYQKSNNNDTSNIFSLQQMNEKKNKKNFKVINEKQINLIQNPKWIEHLNNVRLQWRNFRNSPIEIKIMLEELEKQSSNYSVTQLFRTQAVSKPMPLSSRFSQKDKTQINNWIKQFPVYRQIRGDGNCFYRAFNFAFLEMALTNFSSIYFLKFLSVISDSKNVKFQTNYQNKKITQNSQTSSSRMRSFVINRLLLLYSYRVTLQQSQDQYWQKKIINLLEQVFNEPPFCFDTFLIIGLKNYVISQLEKQQSFEKASSYGIQTISQIHRYGIQCQLNQFPIKILSNGLQICVSLCQQIDNRFRFEPYGQKPGNEKVILYFRPGHYDVIYYDKEVYADIAKLNKKH